MIFSSLVSLVCMQTIGVMCVINKALEISLAKGLKYNDIDITIFILSLIKELMFLVKFGLDLDQNNHIFSFLPPASCAVLIDRGLVTFSMDFFFLSLFFVWGFLP